MQELRDGTRWMLRLEDGQDLFPALQEFARRHQVRASVILSGIGMLKHATIGYWNGKQYDPHEIPVAHELLGLHGSIAEVDGAPSIHLHVVMGGPDHRVLGGHLMAATVGVLIELYLESFPDRRFGRPLDESFGLRMLDLEPGPTP